MTPFVPSLCLKGWVKGVESLVGVIGSAGSLAVSVLSSSSGIGEWYSTERASFWTDCESAVELSVEGILCCAAQFGGDDAAADSAKGMAVLVGKRRIGIYTRLCRCVDGIHLC
jgi:hypothetical protein